MENLGYNIENKGVVSEAYSAFYNANEEQRCCRLKSTVPFYIDPEYESWAKESKQSGRRCRVVLAPCFIIDILNLFHLIARKNEIGGDGYMQKQNNGQNVEKSKVIPITLLLIASILITLSGAFFSVYSILYNSSFTVLNTQVHGIVFGLVVLFLGIRYLLSVQKLKGEVYKSTSRFSWSNFKKNSLTKSR